jgi:glycerol uptake facilitator-like aquaporin
VSARVVAAEGIGSALLVLAIVGSGIMAERLCGGNGGLALLANALATGGTLVALILGFGAISAQFNPIVTFAFAGTRSARTRVAVALAQIAGGVAGAMLANVLFGLAPLAFSQHARAGPAMLASEFIATFGLIAVIRGCLRTRPSAVPYAVAAYIVGAYWFMPSTAFANPAVTIARALTDTFSGIRPSDVVPFIVAQVLGGVAATLLFRWFEGALPANVALARIEAA